MLSMLLLKTRKAEGVASVVGGVAVACVRAAAAVVGAVGHAAPPLRRLAARLHAAASRRLPPPPLSRTRMKMKRLAFERRRLG